MIYKLRALEFFLNCKPNMYVLRVFEACWEACTSAIHNGRDISYSVMSVMHYGRDRILFCHVRNALQTLRTLRK